LAQNAPVTNGSVLQFTQPAPHALVVVCALTQVPPQFVIPLGHAHTPLLHTPPVGHAVVQFPQWLALLVVSTHAPEQFVWPAGHWLEHWPAAHTWPDWHVRPHWPQLAGSLAMSTHFPPHRV
jgi:hypothetical protein